MIVVKVEPGNEIIESLTLELASKGIEDAAITSIIGAVDSCCISNMPKDSPKDDTLNEYNEPFELSGCGEVAGGVPHVHCVVSREGEESLAGHLHWAKVENWFVKFYVQPLTN